MCGIIGVVGASKAINLLLDGLERLEYRGYDSSGVAVQSDGGVEVLRAVGKVSVLRALVGGARAAGSSGIGHTRWATHGKATAVNAHPHRAGRVVVVHNGIIENHAALRAQLEAKGRVFLSDTDTECAAQLCDHFLVEGASIDVAVRRTTDALEGAYALLFLIDGDRDVIRAVRMRSPLAIGLDRNGGMALLGSDAIAMAPWADRVIHLDDGEMAVIRSSHDGATASIFDVAGRSVDREAQQIERQDATDIGIHPDHMTREILDQPRVMARIVAARTRVSLSGRVMLDPSLAFPDSVRRVVMIGCGTARYAGEMAKGWFEGLAGMIATSEVASEFRQSDAPLFRDDALIAISQSGETADTMAALQRGCGRVGHLACAVNVRGSSIERLVRAQGGDSLDIMAGPEIGVASTKAFTAQALTLYAIAAATAARRGLLSDAQAEGAARDLLCLPDIMARAITAAQEQAGPAAAALAAAKGAMFLGRGAMHALALEAALKVKELAYVHVEGYAAGEMKHGPIALVEDGLPVMIFAASGPWFDKSVSALHEVCARGARAFLITDADGAESAGHDDVIVMPDAPLDLQPIVFAAAAQILAYRTAALKGCDIDRPRNLAKSVTVE